MGALPAFWSISKGRDDFISPSVLANGRLPIGCWSRSLKAFYVKTRDGGTS